MAAEAAHQSQVLAFDAVNRQSHILVAWPSRFGFAARGTFIAQPKTDHQEAHTLWINRAVAVPNDLSEIVRAIQLYG